MGRRPNALIGEFFRRGRKLEDNSNRYEHQCTKCGELFPKGRIDSMLAHLVKRCPSMTQEDRALVFQHMQGNPESSSTARRQRVGTDQDGQTHAAQGQAQQQQPGVPQDARQHMYFDMPMDTHQDMQSAMQQQMQSSMPLSLLLERQQSALDTLAEVSRRHLDYSEQRNMPQVESHQAAVVRESERDMVEQALMAAFQRQSAGQINVQANGDANEAPTYQTYDSQATLGVGNHTIADTIAALPLVQAATAANRQLEQSQNHQNQSDTLDPQLGENYDATTDQPLSHDVQGQSDFMTWTETPQNFVTQQSPPSNEPVTGFGLLQKSDKSNARARFTDTRRKQVQEIRKRGACIRCRMLKKPCSEGTPCMTCQQVDTARLWKGACLRTRVADEFTLFSTSYFHFKAKAEVPTAVHGLSNGRLQGRLEVKFFPSSVLAITFAAKQYLLAESSGGDAIPEPGLVNTTGNSITLLDEGEGMSEKISDYCVQDPIIAACIDEEPNGFLKSTLCEARSLLGSEAAIEASQVLKLENRANYISPSQLLKQVIELWTETNVLASSDTTETITIRYEGSVIPSQYPQTVDWPDVSVAHVLPPDSRSHQLIKAQLLAATEARCHRLSKVVMNELERRLLQRQQVSGFATFISAVVLLNCVERMTAFYQSLDTTSYQTPQPASTAAGAPPPYPNPPSAPPSWPLDHPPSLLYSQGPRFASLLTMLLRMRALPPRTSLTANGTLAVLQELALPVKLNGMPTRDWVQADEAARKATEWLDPLALNVQALIQRRDSMGSRHYGWQGWDVRFVAAVVLPEGI